MSNLTHSFGNGTGTGNRTLLEDPKLCTLETCDLTLASFLYIPTLPGNASYAAIFGVLTIGQLYLGIRHKTWGYMAAMVLGLVLEIIGYVARVMLHNSPFNDDNFLMYLITLTIAPAFLSAAIYLCLSRIVVVYGAHLSRFKPRTYTIFFCTCDIVSLVLQGAGGGIAASADTADLTDLGKNIMLAGLAFQVVSLTVFAICSTDFAFRAYKGRTLWNREHLRLVNSKLFNAFLLGLVVATVTIFARSVYRCVELSGGFNGELFVKDEALFMVMEGVMIVIACVCLTVLHPAICFQGAWHNANFSFRSSKFIVEFPLRGLESLDPMSCDTNWADKNGGTFMS
ncbi:RTA1 like protein-domain-containing protein [Thelonectria olida]|uniref:RTA1 like protein-domain-containing protein n=1 Tax=Thelonectria olida TaxID=1576542 RepID=A0A9P8VU63_9HYPO|nr:RTA1 like protein-domain-containing protein [Thelonectria olida]